MTFQVAQAPTISTTHDQQQGTQWIMDSRSTRMIAMCLVERSQNSTLEKYWLMPCQSTP
jgi:hypothetical protein